ncbi:MMPL family transporter [Solimonas terrae]|uniref:MMPL family transporter n=1 Tax=Solimonas terrae TaxID=1396819 RepID=UPI0018853994|nr:MMPL family transporter [Solimonas terrae]
MQRLVRWIAGRPVVVLVLSLLLSALAALALFDPRTHALRLQIDPSIERLLPSNNADRALYEQVREHFGDGDAVIVAVEFKDLYSTEGLRLVQQLNARYRQLPGVSGVASLATAPDLVAIDGDLDVSTFTQQAAAHPERIAGFARQIAGNPLYRNTLVSADGRHVAFALFVDGVNEQQFLALDYPQLIRAATREVAGDAAVAITGTPVGRAATARALLDALRFTVPAVFAIILVLLYVSFRDWRATIAAALTVGLTLLWTLASSVLLRMPFNLVTAIVPALVVTLGLSYTIYLLSAYFDAFGKPWLSERGVRTRWVLNRAGLGLLLSAATTAASFLSLLISSLPAIRNFAVLASLGSLFGVLLSLSFLPSLLTLSGCARRETAPPGARWFSATATRLAAFDQKWRAAIIGVAVLLLPVDAFLASRIHAGTEFSKSFSERSTVRRDYELINRDFDGANLMSIYIDTHVNDALTDPALIGQLDSLEQWLRAQPEVGAAVSYVDHLKLINRAFNDGDPAAYAIPDSAAAVKQLLVFGGGDAIRNVIDPRFRSALMKLRIKVDGSREVDALVKRIDLRLQAMPAPLNGVVTGTPILATRTVQEIASGQFLSIAIASVAIWLLLTFMFTSARAGLIALLPTVVPVAIYFGTLGLLGIALSPTTCLIACIVIGIAVDDTIQFLARFNADARAGADEAPAVASALAAVLRPITLSTIALCSGFLVFAGSTLATQVQFGLLSAFTLFLAWVMNITLTPALGSKLRIVTLWDMLRLDLGESPQHTIPLLSGLSLRQARVFALMSRLEKHPQATRVIRQGDLARDIYVVVDGELEVWIERQDEHKSLARLGRGAVLGEAGYFGQRRTANVQALSPVRLLRFDSQDLERLRIRYPKVAALVLRNLNRIQAERLARATAMLQ